MTQQPQVALHPGRPLNRAVAIVDAALNPIVQALCWILLKAGVRLVLCDRDERSVDELARDYNLCMGCDPNYMDEPRGAWDSLRAVPAKVEKLTLDTTSSLVDLAVRAFERSPDFVVDMGGALSDEFLWAVSGKCMKLADSGVSAESKSEITTVRPFSHHQLLMPGAFETSREHSEDVQLKEHDNKHPCLHAFCGIGMASKVRGGIRKAEQSSNNEKNIAVVLSNDPIVSISHIISGGKWCPNLSLIDLRKGVTTFSEPVMSLDVGYDGPAVVGENLTHPGLHDTTAEPGLNKRVAGVQDGDVLSEQVARRPGEEDQSDYPMADKVVKHMLQDREEITLKQQALSVLDCRCQYQIVQELVKGGVKWLVLCYILVMVTIPRLFGGSYL